MAVELYRRGTTHERNGIECEAQAFNEFNFMLMLDVGWFLSTEEAYGKDKETKIRESAKEAGIIGWNSAEIEELKEMLGIEDNGREDITSGLKDDEIRQLAKTAKISNWHNRKIETLKEMLNDAQD